MNSSDKQKAIQLLSKHTSGFIPNQGQIYQQAKYYLRGSSFQVYFTKEDIRIVLFEKRKKEKDDPIERIKQRQAKETQEEMKQKGWVVNISLVNPNANLYLDNTAIPPTNVSIPSSVTTYTWDGIDQTSSQVE